jgi:hypothetical protein
MSKDRRDLGFLITTNDASWRHFDRVLGEFTRLGFPFAVNFDHCCNDTKRTFKAHPLCVGWHETDDPKDLFDETHKQRALDVLYAREFAWAAYLDTDEVFDRRAPEEIAKILGSSGVDLYWCPLLDFWGDDEHYRTDGPLGPCQAGDWGDGSVRDKQFRNKFYHLRADGAWRYLHADVHGPYFLDRKTGERKREREARSRLHVLHYGLIDLDLIRFKLEQWRRVYTPALGEFKHGGFYEYLLDPALTPEVRDFCYATWNGE